MTITFEILSTGVTRTLSDGSQNQAVSGLRVGVSRQSILSAPINGAAFPTPAYGQSLAVDFAVIGSGPNHLGGYSSMQSRDVNELGILTITAPDGSASIVFTPAVMTARKPAMVAGGVLKWLYTFVAVTASVIIDPSHLVMTDDGYIVRNDDGTPVTI